MATAPIPEIPAIPWHKVIDLPAVCQLYILFYALNGSRPNIEWFVTA